MTFRKLAIGLTLSLSVIAAPVIMAVPSVAADVMLSTPTGLKTTDQTPTSIGLSWNAVAGAPQYRIQYSLSSDMSNSNYARSSEGENAITIDMRDLKANTTYYFKVRVIKTDGTNLSDYSPAIVAKTLVAPTLTTIPNQLSVATYNVHCHSCNTDPANSWINRRDSVIANVKSRMPDVIGVQEASQGWIKDANGNQLNLSQFEDLRNRLNAAGAPYEVTNSNRNNCVNSATPVNCVYADQGASFDSKIFYNKNTVTLISQGSAALPNIPGDSNSRYMAWASFKQNSTGKSFFVTDTHLDPRTGTPELFEEKRQQAAKITQVIAEKNTAKLPVLITGDMNSSKWFTPSNAPYDEFTKAGYIDPIGGTWGTSLASGYATAEKIINGRYSSFNGFDPNLGHTSVTGDRALGSHIDYVFTSKMRVASWEMVLNIDANGILQGQIPSDHNMIMVKVGLPDVTADPSTSAISYAGHVQNIGWQSTVSNGAIAGTTGQGLRLESLRFVTSGQTARAHVQNIGWQNYSTGATTIGTSGQSLRMEAVQVKSTVAGEAIRCQAHVENIGWMPEVSDGEVCGTTGKGLRLEAVRFRVVKQ